MIDAISALHLNTQTTLACCGLDPDWAKFPSELTEGKQPSEAIVFEFMQGVIDASAPHVCAFKAQKAFFDLWYGGHDLLKEVIAYVHATHPGIPVILDCKIGDIDNTMGAYVENIFGRIEADGVVVNPYMGEAVLTPFAEHPKKAIVVLVKTSNPDGAVVQDLRLENGQMLWERVLEYTISRWNTAGNMVPVISSTVEVNLTAVRQQIPDSMPILFAGVGAQGGTTDGVRQLLNSHNAGVFVNSSRGLLYPKRNAEETWQKATEKAVISLKSQLEEARK